MGVEDCQLRAGQVRPFCGRSLNSSGFRSGFITTSHPAETLGSTMITKKELLPVLLVPTAILLIPGAAMAFKVRGWAWGPESFVGAWIILVGVGLAYRLVARKATGLAYRVATGLGLLAGLALLWINGAVGLIGSEENPANLLYGAVLVVGGLGVLLARLEARGMSWALFATAAAQFLVPVVALVARPHDFSPGVAPVFGLNFVFVLLFVASAWLFRRAAAGPDQAAPPATA